MMIGNFFDIRKIHIGIQSRKKIEIMKFSEWRIEYLKCTYLNYGQNVSRSIKFCGKIKKIFCCGHHDWHRRCCSLVDFLDEMR